jgi:hypothetical protein
VDIFMAWHLRPVSSQHAPAVGVELDLSDGVHSGAFKSEIDAADAGEQG